MKVLHFCIFKHLKSGINAQLLSELNAAKKVLPEGCWDIVVFSEDKVESHFMRQALVFQRFYFKRLANYISLRLCAYYFLLKNQDRYDYLLIRYFPGDMFLFFTCILLKTPYITVHHTIEISEIGVSGGLSSRLSSLLESAIGPYVRKRAVAIVGVTDEICNAQLKLISGRKPAFVYPNGIEYRDCITDDRRRGKKEILFMAGFFYPWHGLDRLIDAAKVSNEAFTVHLIGRVSADDREAIEADSRFILHGSKSHEDIEKIASSCILGLSSFALDRNDISQACSLKVREYLMLGLPVYAGYKEVFPDDFRYYQQGPADFVKILYFASDMQKVDKRKVASSARPYIDKGLLLSQLYKTIELTPMSDSE